MSDQQYKVNEDGSVTKVSNDGINEGSFNNSNNDSPDNNGCFWAIIIGIVIGINALSALSIALNSHYNSSSKCNNNDSIDIVGYTGQEFVEDSIYIYL
jgi:hypothetical protein